MNWFKSEARGRGRMPGGKGLGLGGVCTCPKCGAEVKHDRAVPCNKMECPKCGTNMGRESSVIKADKFSDKYYDMIHDNPYVSYELVVDFLRNAMVSDIELVAEIYGEGMSESDYFALQEALSKLESSTEAEE